MVPRALVIAMFTLMAFSIALVAFARLTDRPLEGVPEAAPIVEELTITVSGDRSGVYTIRDTSGQILAVSSDDKAGFLGVIGRVLARDRMQQGVAEDAPLRIVRRTNGQTAVIDDATGRVIELIGYGEDNIAAFANLLDR
jgi:putative photosynthetic complex assembly protein